MQRSNLAYAVGHYREVDLAARVAVASPHQLVTMLFDGLRTALRGAELALIRGEPRSRIRSVTKALAILDALEASLDFGSGGTVARVLAELYGELRALVVAGNAEAQPELLSVAAVRVTTIGRAWAAVDPAINSPASAGY